MSDAPKNTGKRAWFEPFALVLLSMATIGTAWCSYQAAAWGSVAQRTMNLSAATSRRAAVNEIRALEFGIIDVLMFSQFMNAQSDSNAPLAQFYSTRFRDEAKTAFESWMAYRPFENTNAPPHPFVTNLYQSSLQVAARKEETKADDLWQQAGEAGRTSRSYVLVTVLLASALFCAGTAPKFQIVWIHKSILALGLGLILFAIVRLFQLPMHL
jgi:hypothetical protein